MPRSTSHHPRFDYQDYATRLLINRAQFEDDDLKRRIDAFYEHESYEDGSAISDAEEDGEELRKLQEELLQSRSFQWANQVVAKLLEKANSADILEKLSSPIVLEADLTEERLEELSRGDDRQSWKAAIDAADDIVDAFYKDDATNTKREQIPGAAKNVFKIGKVTVTQKGDYEYTYQIPANFTGVIADPKGEEPFQTDFRIYYQGALVCIVPALDVIGLSAEERAQAFEKARNNARSQKEREAAEEESPQKPPLSLKVQQFVDAIDRAWETNNLQEVLFDDLITIITTTLTDEESRIALEELNSIGWKTGGSPIEPNYIDEYREDAKEEVARRLREQGLGPAMQVLRRVVYKEDLGTAINHEDIPQITGSLDRIEGSPQDVRRAISGLLKIEPSELDFYMNATREQLAAIEQAAALESELELLENIIRSVLDNELDVTRLNIHQLGLVGSILKFNSGDLEALAQRVKSTVEELCKIARATNNPKLVELIKLDHKEWTHGDINFIASTTNPDKGWNNADVDKLAYASGLTASQVADKLQYAKEQQQLLVNSKKALDTLNLGALTADHVELLREMLKKLNIEVGDNKLLNDINTALNNNTASEECKKALRDLFAYTYYIKEYKNGVDHVYTGAGRAVPEDDTTYINGVKLSIERALNGTYAEASQELQLVTEAPHIDELTVVEHREKTVLNKEMDLNNAVTKVIALGEEEGRRLQPPSRETSAAGFGVTLKPAKSIKRQKEQGKRPEFAERASEMEERRRANSVAAPASLNLEEASSDDPASPGRPASALQRTKSGRWV